MKPLDVSAYPPARQWAAARINEYIAGQEMTKACLDCALAGLGDWRVRAEVEALRCQRADECARRYQERQRTRKAPARPALSPPVVKPSATPRTGSGRQWWQEAGS